jgi:integrase
MTLGPAKGDGLADARKEAKDALRKVEKGIDPLRERALTKRPQETVDDLAADWLASKESQDWRPKTRAEFERIVEAHVVKSDLGRMAPAKVTRPDIRRLLDGIGSDSTADHTRAVVRLLFVWALSHDRIDGLPLFPGKRTKYEPRSRVLDHDETRRVWAALDTGLLGIMGSAFRLMLLTAQRRGEVLSMRWVDVAEEKGGRVWTIPAERTKNGRAHRVPITAMVAGVLESLRSETGDGEYVFPSPRAQAKLPFVANPQKAAGRLWKLAGVEGATLHDLRRTAGNGMALAGIPDLHVAYVLNHSGRRDAPAVTSTYTPDPSRLDGHKRVALEVWERSLRRILEGAEADEQSNVVPMRA